MGAISERMLARGCVRNIERVHGEQVKILSGLDAGKSFTAVVEIEQDLVLGDDGLGNDPRAKVMCRFSVAPNIDSQDVVQTADGKKWNAIKRDFSDFLTTDFELMEIISAKDAQ